MDRFTELLEDEDTLVKPLTLILGVALLIGFLLAGNAVIKEIIPTWGKRQLLVDVMVVSAWVGFWLYKRRRYPKNKSEKIGIVIALTTENNKEKQRIKIDLIRKFNELILADNLQDSVAIVPFKNFQATRIIPKLACVADAVNSLNRGQTANRSSRLLQGWTSLRNKINGHLFIYGHVSERQAGENSYFINTNSLVAHIPLAIEVRQELSQDFLSIWSRQFSFFEKFEKAGFDFTAQYWFLAAKYIIGCAAFASGDVATALKLHEGLLEQLRLIQGHPNMIRIRQRVNSLLAQEHVLMCNQAYNLGNLKLTREHLDKSFAVDPKNYSAYLMRAIIEFANEGNPHKALKTIETVSRFAGQNRTWQYSQAFLLLYLERFDKGLGVYRKIANYTFKGEEHVLPQVIAFNEQRLLVEPNKIQSLFILGFLYFKKLPNYPEALHHFEHFLRKARGTPKYNLLVKEAEIYLRELKRNMGLS